MKKLFIIVTLIAVSFSAQAWDKVGHSTVVEIAKRHLTEKTKKNIAKYMPYDIEKDASWMDYNRGKKSPYRFTNSWHSYYYDSKFRHDPNVKHKIQNNIFVINMLILCLLLLLLFVYLLGHLLLFLFYSDIL